MKPKETQAVRRQLQQLDAELREFKAELLAARVVEIKQAARRPAGKTYPPHVKDQGDP